VTFVVSVACTEAEAAEADLSGFTLAAHERDDGTWRLELYTEARPDQAMIAALATLAPSADAPPTVRVLEERDWVKFSQSALVPVTVGRFHVYAEPFAHTLRLGRIGLKVEAGRAFGTGHHATTVNCLAAIDRHKRRGGKVRRALDLGTGTGVLALGIAKRWRRARVVAADIDPVAVEVARTNLRVNGVRGGRAPGAIETARADGMHARRLHGNYELIVANILARPLRRMAPSIVRALAPGGRLVLAGLLQGQARRVWAAYAGRGLRTAAFPRRVAWPALEFTRARAKS